jgi:superfamily II DNA/RNA helicase
MLLSATPVSEGLLDLWAQMNVLDGGKRLGDSYWGYKRKYFVETGPPRYITTALPHSEKQIRNKIADVCFRLESSDYVTMPDIQANVIPATLPPTKMVEYRKFEKDFVHTFDDGEIALARSQNTLVNKLRQFVNGAVYLPDHTYRVIHWEKVHALKDTINSLSGRRALVAVNYHFEVDMIRKKINTAMPVIHGKVPQKEKQRLIRMWNNKQIPVLLCHPKSIGHGMNLQRGGDVIIWYSLPWAFDPYDQLIGRLARQGQKSKSVVVHHLLVKNTIDYVVMKVLQRKGGDQANFLSAIKSMMGGDAE